MRAIRIPIVAGILALATGAVAQQQPAVQPQPAPADPAQTAPAAAPEPAHFAVVGLADNDLLNIRATATANGMMIGRLPAGSVVQNLGCAEVRKNRWCKIADVNNSKLQGWAAARYLDPIDYAADPAGEAYAPEPGSEQEVLQE